MSAHPTLSLEVCRRLLLSAQAPVVGGKGVKPTLEVVRQLGFVQLDSINVLARAHHLTLRARLPNYRPEQLRQLLAGRHLFEAWTHDASLIPVEFLPYWRYRFTRYPERVQRQAWWRERLGGDPEALVRGVLDRVKENGPMTSRVFESESKSGTWWGWKPEKTALEYLWRSGELAISDRQGFVKVYDLMERVFPQQMGLPVPTVDQYHDWAFSEALHRLGAATPRELADFWGMSSAQDAASWCATATATGQVEAVQLEQAGPGVAVLDWEPRAEAVKLSSKVRILNPFDPIVRDRKRLLRLFGMDYRFEAYVPGPKRIYGYFVLPVLRRDRFIARLDAKFHRDRSVLEIKGLWWEPGVRLTSTRQNDLGEAVERLALWLGQETGKAVVVEGV